MANTANTGSRNESRRKPRRQLRYGASILTEPGQTPRECTISDVSEIGARLVIEGSSEELPPRFVLLLTKDGSPRRTCRIVWREGSKVGVAFTNDEL